MARRFFGLIRLAILAGLLAFGIADPGAAQLRLNPAFDDAPLRDLASAKGAVIWSHGRSPYAEESRSPSPAYLTTLRHAGWDVFRFDRARDGDRLHVSAQALAGFVSELKQRGYSHVVLAGQSFGAFLSLMAAGASDDVDAVIATAPAAFGSFSGSYDTWRKNADVLYATLQSIRRARVMLFFFHGDDYDPGGRGPKSQAILDSRRIESMVVDQPSDLVGHGAANTGLFVRRFGDCIQQFIDPGRRGDMEGCSPSWGRSPSAQMPLAEIGRAAGSSDASSGTAPPTTSFWGQWYGFYVNGREILLSIERIERGKVLASYALGPGVAPDQRSERTQRMGRIIGDELVFDEPGLNVLRYSLRPDGRLAGSWSARDGRSQLHTVLRRLH